MSSTIPGPGRRFNDPAIASLSGRRAGARRRANRVVEILERGPLLAVDVQRIRMVLAAVPDFDAVVEAERGAA